MTTPRRSPRSADPNRRAQGAPAMGRSQRPDRAVGGPLASANATGTASSTTARTARGRVLRLGGDELFDEGLAVGLAMRGVTVVPLDSSPVDGRPSGWVPPAVLLDEHGAVVLSSPDWVVLSCVSPSSSPTRFTVIVTDAAALLPAAQHTDRR